MTKSNTAEKIEEFAPEEKKSTHQMLLIQITRIGDVIQTIQAARNFKALFPDYSLDILTLKSFGKPLEFLLNDTFDNVYYLDHKEFFSESKDFKSVKGKVSEFLKSFQLKQYSVSINCSFSKTSAYLNTLISAQNKIGLYRNLLNQICVTDQWSQYVFSNVMDSPLGQFNLVDIFSEMIGTGGSKERQIPLANIDREEKIVIHPFGSESRKHFKPTKWTEIILKLRKSYPSYKIILVGSKNEEAMADEILNNSLIDKSKIENLVGKTTIKEVYTTLRTSRLFVGHDSMVGHLAALTETQTLTISLGSVRPNETSPYITGGFTLSPTTGCYPCFLTEKCEHFKCHSDIPYQVIYESISQLLTEAKIDYKTLKSNISAFHLNSVKITSNQLSSAGFFKTVSISDEYCSTKEALESIYRIGWLYTLKGLEEDTEYPSISKRTSVELDSLLKGLENYYELSQFGRKYSQGILEEVSKQSPDISAIKSYSEKIDEVDKLSKLTSESFPLLHPLISFYTTQKGNLKGENIVQLTESSFHSYNDQAGMTRIVYELIGKTIQEFQIKSKVSPHREQGR